MEQYKNRSGQSNVYAYEIGSDYILVIFKDGKKYWYTYESAGTSHVEHMKILAERGEGLNSYISREVRKLYARKE